MDDVMYQTEVLNKTILESDEYIQYVRAKEELKKDEELYARTNEFRKRSMCIQLEADYNTFDEMNTLYYEYRKTIADPRVTAFIIAEQRIMKMLRCVENMLYDNLDVDTALMED